MGIEVSVGVRQNQVVENSLHCRGRLIRLQQDTLLIFVCKICTLCTKIDGVNDNRPQMWPLPWSSHRTGGPSHPFAKCQESRIMSAAMVKARCCLKVLRISRSTCQ